MATDDISKKYVKLEQREHVLQKPGMYVGSVDVDSTYNIWLLNEDGTKMDKRTCEYVPGLFKIFDEVVTNASDHYIRQKELLSSGKEVNPVKDIKVTVDKESGEISVYNSGDGIDVVVHPEHKIYVPELIFGNLLTSTNYTDDEKTWGGTNGAGSKLTSIFSEYFEVETVDAERGKLYKQRFSANMSVIEKPKITACKKRPYTKITFKPDYARFGGGMPGLSDDMYEVMRKRVYDLCAVTDRDINIYFNESKLEFKTFEKYVDLYLGSKSDHTRVHEEINERWEVIAAYNDFGGAEQVSFVNGLLTIRGGKHVEYIVNQIVKKMTDTIEKKCKGKQVKPQAIKDNMIVFIKCTIVNPAFDSQSKETLTTPASKFGSKAEISDKFVDKLYKSGMADRVLEICALHEEKALKKTDGKKQNTIRGLPKLSDANWAGTAKSKECLLLLCEGDSASSSALAGLAEVGRDSYGVFPLKGKVMNVKDVAAQKIADNDEIANIKKILGLETGKKYAHIEDLRYGGIMLMTDQDSVTGDTPLLLKKDNKIYIETIERIGFDWESCFNGKDYGKTDFQVWNDSGWTPIVHVMRHKVQKKIYRIVTHTGIVDVTEDHSLLDKHGNKISPMEMSVGTELLHSFPVFEGHTTDIPEDLYDMHYKERWKLASKLQIQYYQSYKTEDLIAEILSKKMEPVVKILPDESFEITEDEAYVMGLFWADGSSGIYEWKYKYKAPTKQKEYNFNRITYNWSITNSDIDLLEKSKEKISKIYDYEFKIIQDKSKNSLRKNDCYKLIANGHSKTKPMVEKYTELFYYKNKHPRYKNGNKRVPMEILNAPENIRMKFLEGYYAGDGVGHDIYSTKVPLSVNVESKISAQGIYYLFKSLGYLVSMMPIDDKNIVLNITRPGGKLQENPIKVKKIIELGYTEDYVYDLETENHHFNCGVGSICCHNTDGFHIRGLIMNLFQSMWPSLLKEFRFIHCMNTPIVKARRGNEVVSFYSLTDFENWNKENPSGWEIKYYKGLGTSTEEEAKEWFRNMKTVTYKFTDKSEESLDLAFNKQRADDRKEWLGGYDRQAILDYNNNEIPYEDFINKELIHFSNYDVERSIPSMVDGLKISQRKILYSCFKTNLTGKEMKVAQLAAYVAQVSGYHHGEVSLQDAIVNMAQNFVGSNNINLLQPNGQFGTRLIGGSDAAQPRYIYTLLTEVATAIFRKQDNQVLKYLQDDDMPVEPEFYVPIIPMILVNGAQGIGTGFSTTIPCYNPLDIVALLRRMLAGEHLCSEEDDLQPWYRGFRGRFTKIKERLNSVGLFERTAPTKIEVSELPVGYWTFKFKTDLEKELDRIEEFKKYEDASAGNVVSFTLHFASAAAVDVLMRVEANGLTRFENEFGLASPKGLSTSNMYAFNSAGQITKYDTVFDIVNEFYDVRLGYYQHRKDAVLAKLRYDMEHMQNKIRFIREVVAETIKVHKIKRAELEAHLATNAYRQHEGGYEYITRIPVYNLTLDKVEDLEQEIAKAQDYIAALEATTPQRMWLEELEELEAVYKRFLEAGTGAPAKAKATAAKGRGRIKKI